MSPSHAESIRRVARSLLPAALLALAPKCILCVLAYAGLGAALGIGGAEICGASAASSAGAGFWSWSTIAGIALGVAWPATYLGVFRRFLTARRRGAGGR